MSTHVVWGKQNKCEFNVRHLFIEFVRKGSPTFRLLTQYDWLKFETFQERDHLISQ